MDMSERCDFDAVRCYLAMSTKLTRLSKPIINHDLAEYSKLDKLVFPSANFSCSKWSVSYRLLTYRNRSHCESQTESQVPVGGAISKSLEIGKLIWRV